MIIFSTFLCPTLTSSRIQNTVESRASFQSLSFLGSFEIWSTFEIWLDPGFIPKFKKMIFLLIIQCYSDLRAHLRQGEKWFN